VLRALIACRLAWGLGVRRSLRYGLAFRRRSIFRSLISLFGRRRRLIRILGRAVLLSVPIILCVLHILLYCRRAFLRVYLLHDILHAQSQYHGHAEQECDDSPDAVSFLRLPGFHDVLLPFLVSYCLSVRSLPRRCPPAAARRG